MVKTIRDNIITRTGLVLGASFSKISFTGDLSANKFGKSSKRFGVVPDNASETAGVLGANTLDHKFIMVLTDGYNAGAATQVSDDLKMEKIVELQDKALEIYKSLQANKSSISASVLIINNLNINAVEFLEEEKVAVIRFELTVKYKIN